METLTLQIPDSWQDVNIAQYQEYTQYLKDNKNERLDKIIINILSILTDTDIELLYKLEMETLYDLQDKMGFIEQEPSAHFKNIIEVNGVRYGFQKDLHKLTLGEWIDIEHYMVKGDIINNLHYLVGIFYRKIVKEGDEYFDYEIEPYTDVQLEGRAKLFRHNVNVELVYGISVFFYLIGNELWNNITSSSTQMTMEEKTMKLIQRIKNPKVRKKLMQSHEKTLLKSSTGSSYSTNLVEEILQSMKQY